MNYRLEFSDAEQIISVIYSGAVPLEDRKQAVKDVCSRFHAYKPFKILVDVRELVMDLSLEEQRNFGEYLANHADLGNAKVAVVHDGDINPNLAIDTYAYINGYRITEFNRISDATTWLLEP